jgi:hypothetical protein
MDSISAPVQTVMCRYRQTLGFHTYKMRRRTSQPEHRIHFRLSQRASLSTVYQLAEQRHMKPHKPLAAAFLQLRSPTCEFRIFNDASPVISHCIPQQPMADRSAHTFRRHPLDRTCLEGTDIGQKIGCNQSLEQTHNYFTSKENWLQSPLHTATGSGSSELQVLVHRLSPYSLEDMGRAVMIR